MPYKDPEKRKEVRRKSDAKRAGQRARAWTAIVYPESAPEDWMETLASSMVQALVSPLHDKDTLPTGELKKPHYHVVISYTNPTTYEKAREVFESIGAVIPPCNDCKVKDFRQMARYLCHLDLQGIKYVYSTSDVKEFGGLDYSAIVMSGADEDAMLDEMEAFIERNRICSFTHFQKYVREQKPEWRYVLRHKYSYYIRETIKANQWAILNDQIVAEIEGDMSDWE